MAAYSVQILRLIDSVFADSQIPLPEDDRKTKRNHLNSNFRKTEFQALWNRIHRKAVYAVRFESEELIGKCIATLNAELRAAPLQYVVQRGEQLTDTTYEGLRAGEGFELQETQTASLKSSVHSAVKYDLIGKLAEQTQLTRGTIGRILGGIKPSAFAFYQVNPEDFLRNAARLIDEQKATVVVEHLTYSAVDEAYGVDIFTEDKLPVDSSRAVKTNRLRLYGLEERAGIRRLTRRRNGDRGLRQAAQGIFNSDAGGRLYPRLGDRFQARRGQACLFCRGDKGLNVVNGVQENRGDEDRVRSEVFLQDRFRAGEVWGREQLRQADGAGSVGANWSADWGRTRRYMLQMGSSAHLVNHA